MVVRALWELTAHNLLATASGFQGVYSRLARTRVTNLAARPEVESEVFRAVGLAVSLFPRRVWCLQRSAVTVRLLRKYGSKADFVVGYRPEPFFSHAWVEIDGRVVNGDRGYQRQLAILMRC
jgi:hypothetical protein